MTSPRSKSTLEVWIPIYLGRGPDILCFRCTLMPLSAGYWPLLDLMFLTWVSILSLLLLQVHKINSLFNVAKNHFNHQSIFLILYLDFIFVCLFFHFNSLHWVLIPASAADLSKIRLTCTTLGEPTREENSPFPTALLLSLIPLPEISVSAPQNDLCLYWRVYKLGSHHLLSSPHTKVSHSKAS